jgi:hypothetical protein
VVKALRFKLVFVECAEERLPRMVEVLGMQEQFSVQSASVVR